MPRRFWEYISRSTLKREAAAIPMFWMMICATIIMFRPGVTFEQQIVVLGLFHLPLIGIYAGAFTLDWASKQTNLAGPPMNTETAVTTEPTATGGETVTTSSEHKP